MLLRPRLASRVVELLESNGIPAGWADGQLSIGGERVKARKGPDGQLELAGLPSRVERRALAIFMACGAQTPSPGWVHCGPATEAAVLHVLRSFGHAFSCDSSGEWTVGTVGDPGACVHFDFAHVPDRGRDNLVVLLSTEASIEQAERAAKIADEVEAMLERSGLPRLYRTPTSAQAFVPTQLKVFDDTGERGVELNPESRLWVGSEGCCELQPTGRELSPRHAEFQGMPPGRFWVRPLSPSPVLLNGRPLTGSVMLCHGDEVACGTVRLVVEEENGDETWPSLRALLDEIDRAPGDERAWAMLEDFLLEREDPLGAWMQDSIGSDLWTTAEVSLRHGFIRGVRIIPRGREHSPRSALPSVKNLVLQPLARFVEQVSIELKLPDEALGCIGVLQEARHLRHLAAVELVVEPGVTPPPTPAARFAVSVAHAPLTNLGD